MPEKLLINDPFKKVSKLLLTLQKLQFKFNFFNFNVLIRGDSSLL